MGIVIRETLPVVDAVVAKMEERGISARGASRAMGLSAATVSNWMRGATSPPLNADTQLALAKFLESSPRRVVELFQLDLSDAPLGSGESRG